MSSKKRSAEDEIIGTPRKLHRSAQRDEEEEELDFLPLVATTVSHVFEAPVDACPPMEEIRTETADWANPIILIITRETRDIVVQYLQKIITNSDTEKRKETLQKHPEREELNEVFCQNEHTEEAISGLTTFNKDMIPLIQNKYETVLKDLDKIQSEFTETELKRNLYTDEQFQ